MPDFRCHCPAPAGDANPPELLLSAGESHHLVAANRARRGDRVVAFDGRGREWLCELARDSKTAATLRVLSSRQAPPPPCPITLAQALPKGAAMDAIVRKAVEIGAACIVPLASERSQVHLNNTREDRKAGKWRAAALEAAKQCGNPWLPEIRPVQNTTAFLREFQNPPAGTRHSLRLVASLHDGARPLKAVFAEHRAARAGQSPQSVFWLIGPEGDFSPAEMLAATAAGFAPVTLGPLVLRCETAAIYALSVTTHELQ